MDNHSEYPINLSDGSPMFCRSFSSLSKELDSEHIDLTVNYKEEHFRQTRSLLYRDLHLNLTHKPTITS